METFAEVVVIFVHADIVAIVAVGSVHVSVRALIVISPAVHAVGLSGAETFLVAVIDRVLDHLRTVLARVVVAAVTVIAIIVAQVVVVTSLLKTDLISADLVPVTLLITKISLAALAFEFTLPLLLHVLPVLIASIVFIEPLAL